MLLWLVVTYAFVNSQIHIIQPDINNTSGQVFKTEYVLLNFCYCMISLTNTTLVASSLRWCFCHPGCGKKLSASSRRRHYQRMRALGRGDEIGHSESPSDSDTSHSELANDEVVVSNTSHSELAADDVTLPGDVSCSELVSDHLNELLTPMRVHPEHQDMDVDHDEGCDLYHDASSDISVVSSNTRSQVNDVLW